ncbi:vWA domain-containing protein [Mycolicibacterium mageritense]|uniref:vWA domain-containing protein n=1 Tax=Mycolicibacterium mageritense TaxID=53462 RepID=UPI0011DA4879|nr:VWA domain-containing protein [Mycolicibacterium mageritense]TXI65847.1 MAG: VWA domain-containing protein [Mycolicibacterium mageritense]
MRFEPVAPVLVLVVLAMAVAWASVAAVRSHGRRAVGSVVAAVLLLIAAARPVIGGSAQPGMTITGDHEPSIFVVVDRSADMAERGADGRPRITAAQDDLASLIDRYPRARFAVIGFAARPALDWPLSDDQWSLRPVVSTLNPEPAAAQDQTNVGAAATLLRYQLISAVQQYPRAQNLVFYLGAGAPGSQAVPRDFDLPADSVDGGAVLGYGTGSGADTLRAVADQIGVPYLPRAAGGLPDDAFPHISAAETGPSARTRDGIETYWIFALGAAALIVTELFRVLTDFRRTRFGSRSVLT